MQRKIYLLALAALLLAPHACAQGLCFQDAVNYSVWTYPESVIAADLDGDGDLDLVTANWDSGNVSILKNNGDGTFASPVYYGAGSNSRPVFAADLDGDGDLDLAVANWGSGNVSVLKNNGDGTFATALNYAAGSLPQSVFAVDLDGDGDRDLAVANSGSSNVSVLKNNGDGAFAAAVNYAAGPGSVWVFAADLEGDGDKDLAVANELSANVSVLMNHGDGSFASAVDYAVGNHPRSVIADDLDGDGDQDFAAVNSGNDNVSVLKNNGDGTFTSAVNYAVGTSPCAFFAADLDGDGDRDLAVTNYNGGSVSVLQNNGNGTFAAPVNYMVGTNPYSVVAADLDGDGDQDLAVDNVFSNNISVLINCLHIPRAIRVPQDYGTIQAAINAAMDTDTVLVSPGTFAEHIDFLGKGIVVRGLYGPDSTVITKLVNGLDLVTFHNGEGQGAVLTGFHLMNTASYAINCQSSPTIIGNVFSDIANYAISSAGGAVITQNTFRNLSGGIYVDGGSPQVTKNLFHHNGMSSVYVGYNGGSPQVTENLFYKNGLPYWAVIDCYFGGPILVDRNTLIANEGYGVRATSASSVIRNNIIAYGSGYGVYCPGESPVLSHNDVIGNIEGDYYGILPDTASISADPLPCDTAAYDFQLASNSPCVGAGAGGVDIGALGIGCTNPAPEPPMVQQIGIDFPSDSLHVTNHWPMISWAYFDQQSRPHTKSQLEVGTDNDWALAEKWQPPTILGPDTSIQYAGLPLADATTYHVRVRVFNDTLWSQWAVAPFRMNGRPFAPIPLSPANDAVVRTGRPNLVVMNSSDAEGDPRQYDFEVYRDSALTVGVNFVFGLLEGSGQTEWKTDSLTAENQCHWWRARASDGFEYGPWSEVRSFWVDAYNEPPAFFDLLGPTSGAVIFDPTPTFSWNAAIDPDPAETLTYTLTLGLDSLFTFHSDVGGIPTTSYDWPSPLPTGINYYWEVRVDDGSGGTATSASRSFKISPLGDLTGNGVVDVFDVLFLISYTFNNGPAPNPSSMADLNGDCVVNVLDVLYMINYVFINGPAPVMGCP